MFLPKKPKRYLTILFSDQDLKIAKLDKKGVRLKTLFEFPLPSGLIVEGEVKNPEKLGQFLANARTKAKLKDRFVVAGLSEMKASTHSLLLPNLSPQEIDSAIKFQADSFLPFPYQDEYLDWMLIAKTEENRSKVLVSAVPKKIIDDYTFSLERAGWEPIAFETTSLSLLRLLPPEGKKLSFAAEIGETAVVLILGLKGNLEACSVIHEPNEFLPTTKKMSDFYFPKEKKEKRPQNIYLCGKNINQALLKEIKENLKMTPLVLKAGAAGIPEKREIELAILFSLAQKKAAPPEDIKTINILPQRLAAKYQALSQKKKEKYLILGLLFLLAILNAATYLTYFQIKNKNEKLSKKVEIQETQTKYQPSELMALSEKAKLINQVSQENNLGSKILEKIPVLSSPKAEISGFHFDKMKKELILGGWAETRDDLFKLKEGLEKEDLFSQVFVPLSTLGKEKDIEFKIKLIINQ